MTELESLLLLNSVPGLGNAGLRRLLKHFGSAQKVFALSEKELILEGGVTLAAAEHIHHVPRTEQLRQELQLIKEHGVRVVSWMDEGYPDLLRKIPDAPVLLYIKGVLPAEGLSIAMVGSRRASVYGLTSAEKLAVQLAEYGITVVSGLARGIDTAAHRGALKAKGRTVAVLGSGLANIYPIENQALAQTITENGAIVSEFPMRMPPLAFNFPRRNRIVSGLSLGVVVVEASLKSGALITAETALDQGREVFAMPGKIDCPNAAGTHQLIKDGAKLLTGLADILEELGPQMRRAVTPDPALPQRQEEIFLNSFEKMVYECITNVPQHMDDVMATTKMNSQELTVFLLALEIKGLIQQRPGHFFVRATREALSTSYV